MKINYINKPVNFLFILTALVVFSSCNQEIPLVYQEENTGIKIPASALPDTGSLPRIEPLPDPFAWADGNGRVTRFKDWHKRRAEIMAEIEKYEIGEKPLRPDTLDAQMLEDTLIVTIVKNGETLELKSYIKIPEGTEPFPVLIGIGRPSGTLPPEIFTNRNIALVTYNFNQVMSHTQTRGNEPINRLYPNQTDMGAYCAWPWGVSRLIDGLELVAKDLQLDLKHIGITSCSFAGKMALFSGALDERIALTIAQEPGGGGAAAWRVSETLGNVETLGKTSHAWFKESMFDYADKVSILPYDHHELMTLILPRALLVLGNPDYEWLAEESGYVSCRAAHEVWKTFEIGDRFGFSIVAGHPHCQLPESQYPEVEAFIDKFLLGKTEVNTNITISPYDEVDYTRWINWWGTDDPSFPE